MSRYIFSKNNRWYISQVFDPSDSKLQEKASYYTLTDDITGPYYVNNGESDSIVPLEVSYAPVYSGGSDSLSFSKVTVTPGDVLAGKFFYTSGKVLEEGTIQTIVASLSANKVTIPRGFIESDSIIVPQADPLVVAGNTVTVPVGYIASQRVAEIPMGGSAAVQGNVVHIPSGYRAQSDSVVIPEGGAITVDGNVVRVPAGYRAQSDSAEVALGGPATVQGNVVHIPMGYRAQSDSISIVCQGGISIEAGYIDANGNFQPLSFDGTQASDSGSAVAGLQHKIFNTGHDEPDYGGSGGTMEFYKCTYVNSDSWGGRKAAQDPVTGIYSFESNSTEGLSYNKVKPRAGEIYSNDALILARLYTGLDINLVFYTPLASATNAAETGQAITTVGTVTYDTISGIPCAYFNGNGKLVVTDVTKLPILGASNTIAGWFRFDYVYEFNLLFGYGDEYGVRAYHNYCEIVYNKDGANYVSTQSTIQADTWYHIAATWDGSKCKVYLNGSLSNESGSYRQTFDGSRPLTIGAMDRFGNGQGYVADIRVYDRALSALEIYDLFTEFTPASN